MSMFAVTETIPLNGNSRSTNRAEDTGTTGLNIEVTEADDSKSRSRTHLRVYRRAHAVA